ncbi:lipase family protein [Corynebacterium heidelbergense]|uniref:Lipase n=1 Tax=Corynebacterium heidelbergense TaxID=2055947 RepID=A0A364VBM1_9CORY|nr:lipase family protein [Corynebacterium heidelbergense]RAV34049.1 lipase [Corynebacterium heidelbergense]WCZ35633.1 putative inactive lipase [Corynebacterium heidelbergense]
MRTLKPSRVGAAITAVASALAIQAGVSALLAAPAAAQPEATPATPPGAVSPADPGLAGSTVLGQTVPFNPGFALPETLPGVYNPNDPFYLPPANLPTKPGSLIRTEPAPQLLNPFANGGAGSAQKILYSSTTEKGDPVAVSGFTIEPVTSWRGKGPTPTIVFAPGTRGAADVCAPSREAALFAAANPNNLSVGLDYELPFMYLASAMGIRVVATDLIGLGTPGAHTYVNTRDEAHATLDAARAGLAALKLPADSPVGFYGYSQGGGATAAAAEYAEEYAPDINLKGTYAGAPPSNLYEVAKAVDGNAIAGVLGYVLNGELEREPQLAYLVDQEFNEKGKRFLEETEDRCIVDTVGAYGFTDTRTLTKTGESFNELLDRLPDLRAIVDAQILGKRKLNAPMLVINGRADDTIPFGQARQMAADYCSTGSAVQFVASEIPPILPKSAVNHALPLIEQLPTSYGYLIDRFNNVPAPSNCGQF